MYQLATCRASIFRGTVTDTEFGDKKASNVPHVKGTLAAIVETDTTIWDAATNTPRMVRRVSASFPYGTDVQANDRVHDDTFDVDYWVVATSLRRMPGRQPDVSAELRRVGS